MSDPADSIDGGRVHRASTSVEYATNERARAVAAAVGVETGAIDDDRSTVRCTREGTTVRVTVEATDLVALRAGLNTWLRLVRTAETTADAAAPD